MASTVTAATATVQITESLTLANVDRGGSHTRTITNVAEADRRVMNVASSGETDLVELDTANGQGKFVRASIRYIRITNLDDTNFIRVRVSRTSHDTFDLKIPAGATFMLSSGDISANSSGSAFSSFDDIDVISAQADTADVDVEFVVFAV